MSQATVTAIAAHLASNGEGTVGTDIFTGPPRRWDPDDGMPIACLYVWEDGGPAPDRTHTSVMPRAGINVRVRGPVDSYATAKATADRVFNLLERPGGIVGTVNLENDASAPVYLGQAEGSGPHEFSIPCTAWVSA